VDESLTSFIDEVCGDSHLRVEDDLGDGFVRLRSTEAQRRQAKQDIRCVEDIVIEMLRNSYDAKAKNIFVASSKEGSLRRLSMIDDGVGIPKQAHSLVFEPRVTSKLDTIYDDKWGVHGRGMALYSIAANAQSAQIINSNKGSGTAFLVEVDTVMLPEKTDQSTLPKFAFGEEEEVNITGPHNIIRTIAEFSFEYMDECSVYVGSPTEVLATLYEYGVATVSKSMRISQVEEDELPLTKRLSLAADPAHFVDIAHSLGLDISERSARRILDGEIRILNSFFQILTKDLDRVAKEIKKKKQTVKTDLRKDPRGLKIHEDDLNEFSAEVKAAYQNLAQRYYLEENVSPEVFLTKEAINIKIPLHKLT